MPSLPNELQNQADEAAATSGSFAALEPGVYTARLAKVEATTAQSSGNPMWALEFDTIQRLDGSKAPGRLWTNLVLIDSVMWKVGAFFAGFGVPSSTNTDELINHRMRVQVDKRVITQGKRNGSEGNEIAGFMLLQESDQGYSDVQKLIRAHGGTPTAAKASATPKSGGTQPAAQPASQPAPAEEGVEF